MTSDLGGALRYNAIARTLHWVIAILIIANVAIGLLGDAIEEAVGSSPFPLHKSIGLTVLVLSLLRLGWRIANPPPPLPAHTGRNERRLAAIMHGVLYALMILVPFTGYAMSSAGKYPLSWFGLVTVPKLPIERESALADLMHEGHEVLGIAIAILAAGHIVAAVRHGFLLRDGVLQRMTGGRG